MKKLPVSSIVHHVYCGDVPVYDFLVSRRTTKANVKGSWSCVHVRWRNPDSTGLLRRMYRTKSSSTTARMSILIIVLISHIRTIEKCKSTMTFSWIKSINGHVHEDMQQLQHGAIAVNGGIILGITHGTDVTSIEQKAHRQLKLLPVEILDEAIEIVEGIKHDANGRCNFAGCHESNKQWNNVSSNTYLGREILSLLQF